MSVSFDELPKALERPIDKEPGVGTPGGGSKGGVWGGKGGIVSYLTFMWATPLIRQAFDCELEIDDIWTLRDSDEAQNLYAPLKKNWVAELQLPVSERSLLRAIWKTYRSRFWLCFWLQMGFMVSVVFSSSLVLAELLRILEEKDQGEQWTIIGIAAEKETWQGCGLALAFLVSEGSRSLFTCWQWMIGSITGTQVRSAVRLLLYKKMLRLKNCNVPSGQLVNFIANDTQRMLDAGTFGMFCITSPIIITVVLVVMTTYLGSAALAGFAMLLLLFPAQQQIGKYLGNIRRQAVQVSGRRVQMMEEILSGIKLIKLYAWEESFAAKVDRVREEEVHHLKRAAYIKTTNEVITFSMPFLVALCTFATYYWATGKTLTSSQAFPALALFNVARFPLAILPIGARSVAEAVVGVRRLEKLLQLDEHEGVDELNTSSADGKGSDLSSTTTEATSSEAILSETIPTSVDTVTVGSTKLRTNKVLALEIRNATLRWGTQDITTQMNSIRPTKAIEATRLAMAAAAKAKAAAKLEGGGGDGEREDEKSEGEEGCGGDEKERGMLHGLNVEVYSGELVAIVGAVGSGKSSLLTGALLSQMHLISGSIKIREPAMALCEQSAFIFNATLRENILFGSAFEKGRYEETLRVCALHSDIELLGAGDMTEIGEVISYLYSV
jgi:ATP-binding cassette subfamily C (CFTR/MRP) protein 12